MELPPKICPECRVEYVHTALACSDCGVALVSPEGLPEDAAESLPAASDLTPIRVESGSWIRGLADRLAQAGIAHRVEASPAGPGGRSGPIFALFVRPEDAEQAREIDAEVLRRELPDLSEAPDASATPASDDACPACGAELSADAAECPDCGLNFDVE